MIAALHLVTRFSELTFGDPFIIWQPFSLTSKVTECSDTFLIFLHFGTRLAYLPASNLD